MNIFKKGLSKVKKAVYAVKEKAIALAAALGSAAMAHAQDAAAGVSAINSVTDSLKTYLPVITNLCYVLAGIVGIIGGISVYIAMNNEEQDVKKKIMMVVGACIFLIAVAQAIPLFFGL